MKKLFETLLSLLSFGIPLFIRALLKKRKERKSKTETLLETFEDVSKVIQQVKSLDLTQKSTRNRERKDCNVEERKESHRKDQ